MSALAWFPEPVPPWGAFTADGLRGILGRPRLHPLTILVRETAQNSWDARLPRSQVKFAIDGIQFTDKELKRLRSDVFSSAPPRGLPLLKRLEDKSLRALIIRDSNTQGLGGPIRASSAPEGGANRFVKFIFDYGTVDRAQVEGGTYGFGRSIAYNVSRVHTVVVYTRTEEQLEEPQSRLIAVALGAPYSNSGARFTGRHWWGRVVRGSVQPIVGSRADDLAGQIGFQPFDRAETGTALMILDPELQADPKTAMAFMAESITWHLWPKMVAVNGRRPMQFSVTWEGEKIPVPNPSQLQPLPGYIRALEVLRDGTEPGTTADGVEIVELEAERPSTTLGRIALSKFPFRHRKPTVVLDGDDDVEGIPASPFSANSSHVVLLRKPELVVTYLQFPELPDSSIEWGGVFVASSAHNDAFASAEPPTHDGWEPGTVNNKKQRRIVNIALRRIKRTVNSRFHPIVGVPDVGAGQSVVRVANALGTLFAGIPGAGGSLIGTNGQTQEYQGAGGNRPKVQIERFGPLLDKGVRVSEVIFTVTPVMGFDVTRLHIGVDVAIGDGNTIEKEEHRPLGAVVPRLLHLEMNGQVQELTGPTDTVLDITGPSEVSFRALSTAPDATVVSFSIDAEAVRELEA